MSVLVEKMNYIIQGFLEAFPISSSIHLKMLGISEHSVAFMHGFTGLAALIFFRKRILEMVLNFFSNPILHGKPALIIAPKILLGLFLSKVMKLKIIPINEIFSITLFSALFFVSDVFCAKNRKLEELSYKEVLFAGIVGLFAFFPGASNLGTSYTSFRMLKCTKKESLMYSYIFSIIPSIGAFVLSISDVNSLSHLNSMFDTNFCSYISKVSVLGVNITAGVSMSEIFCIISSVLYVFAQSSLFYIFGIRLCFKLINYLYFFSIYRVLVLVIYAIFKKI
ncbi:undecaprenyl-diphosphate phosphatase [Candidatus Nesciobacter abundans]|uniref:Undecaprenyl-diphosphatase n=1 Tax=Candidatus Nesciobacter abundans TaxID=2601668 RepID=A0A5C0UIN2_9PROT|nr:undecaprenyl-diphosphate phosphatase [Candidatus Nesciobacter abundans]QEK39292.1 undecaprenyl-diphosphate phosphatase [Candidatus Nesciobacter abundans]